MIAAVAVPWPIWLRPRLRKPAPRPLRRSSAPAEPKETGRACGWYESSHELWSGIEVRECDIAADGDAQLPFSVPTAA
jgi:hypothetical protein